MQLSWSIIHALCGVYQPSSEGKVSFSSSLNIMQQKIRYSDLRVKNRTDALGLLTLPTRNIVHNNSGCLSRVSASHVDNEKAAENNASSF